MVLDTTWFYAQKLANSSKKAKVEHPFVGCSPSRFSKLFLFIFLRSLYLILLLDKEEKSSEAEVSRLSKSSLNTIRNIVQANSIEPSSTALRSHIDDLNAEVRNIEFRLQYYFHEHQTISQSLASAKAQLKKRE